MANSIYSRTIRLTFGIAVGGLAWLSLVSLWSTRQLAESQAAVEKAQEAFQKFQHIQVLMESAVASVSSFAMTGEDDRLNAYHYAKLLIPQELRVIDAFLRVLPDEQEALSALDRQIAERLADLDRIVSARRSRGQDAAIALIRQETGRRRDAFERMLSDVQQAHTQEFGQRRQRTRAQSQTTQGILALAALLGLALVGWTYFLVRRENSERRQAEDARSQTEIYLQSVINRIPYMILVKDPQHLRVTLANNTAEEWLGRPQEQILGSQEAEFRQSEEASLSLYKDRQALQEGRLAALDECLALPGKEARLLYTQKIPLPNEDGEIVGLLSISEDVTQRKEAEHLLELSRDSALEAARLRSDFIRNMSHELRTPLSIVIGMATLLQESTLKAEQRKFADTIRRAAEGLSSLTKNILDFTRMETGKLTFEAREMNVLQITDEVAAMMSEQAQAKKITLVTLPSPEVPLLLRGDPTRLRQALTQLVGNAVKFTERGEVRVRLSLEKQTDTQATLKWQISDTGIGIPEAVQAHLFEPFRQGDGSHTRRFGGTGLGLAMAKRLIELLGGAIGFESVPGAGSTFWFTLPLNKHHVHGPSIQMSTLPWTRSRVLIASDNDTTRQMLQQQLGDCALASDAVSSGQGALEILKKEHKQGRAYPLVLLDLQLTDMDGVYLAQVLKRDPLLKGTPLLLIAGDKSAVDPLTMATMGFAGWIPMPCPSQELYKRLAGWLDPGQPDRNKQAA